uniref:Uncharacterized protein n=1 Tax=Rhizophora mucronata TaxID=61149 RepID=A0A2P2R3A6_RHIMU
MVINNLYEFSPPTRRQSPKDEILFGQEIHVILQKDYFPFYGLALD